MDSLKQRVGIVQRVLPTYRVPFFDRLSERHEGDMEVFVGEPDPGEGIKTGSLGTARQIKGRNIHIGRGRWYFCWQNGLLRWLWTFRPDLLVVEVNPRTLTTWVAVLWMKILARPVVGWGLGLLDWPAPHWVLVMRRLLLRQFYRHFDAIIGYSTKAALDYKALGGAPNRVFVARNSVSGVHAETLARDLEERPDRVTAWKEEQGLTQRPVVLFVGRLLAQKRVGDLILACGRSGVACDLVVVGDGPDRQDLEHLARDVFPTTQFLGHREGPELALCFAACDLFVLPGLGGLAIQEAMVYGKPVVVASGDGTQDDLVVEGRTGFRFVAGDIHGLACILSNCLKKPLELKRMGQEAACLVREEHNLDIMVESFLEVFAIMKQS